MLTAVYDQVRTEAGSNAGVAPEVIATESVRTAVAMLQDAGLLLLEPVVARPEMTLREAAELLCRLSRTVKLNDPAEDADQLLRSESMVDYAWASANRAGIPPEEMGEAQTARRLLLASHRPK